MDCDFRKSLSQGTVLDFPGMPCTIEKEIGRGSNAIVYMGTYPDLFNHGAKHEVLIKELFPQHEQAAIFRDETNTIVCLPEGEDTWNEHYESFRYGNRIHLKMLEKNPELTGSNINTFSLNGTEYTLLGYSGGRSMEEDTEGAAQDLKQLAVRMLGLLDALEAFHENGFLHLDIAPDNILLIGRGSRERVMLIDYNSVYDFSADDEEHPYHFSIKPGYTPQEIRNGNKYAISTASDLYSVAAVFYRFLAGEPLSDFQTVQRTPPDVSGCDCMKGMPDTVHSMVFQILSIGLKNLPKSRYCCIRDMRKAFRELIDRIEGIGITHWSLWEAGKKTVQNVIRSNPSFSYLTDPESLFPSNVDAGGGEIMPLEDYMESLQKEEGSHTVLTASGGMGKTTALLRTMEEHFVRYSPVKPAAAYISLYGWKEGSTTWIQDRILENLHYSPETTSFEDARQVLHRLMEKPLQTRNGKIPSVILFIDGFNEASGSTQALTDEMLTLAALEGVRMVVTSRVDMPHLPFRKVMLTPLTPENVREILYDHRLLIPESQQVQVLLQTPMMLSIFIQSAEAEQKQMMVSSQTELLEAYFKALLHKEFTDLPEDADERWQIDAALNFVLPEVAGRLIRKKSSLTDAELLRCVGYCYKMVSAPLMFKAFAQWTGYSGKIRGGCETAEEWFGVIIHDILWKRLGLLVHNERGEYLIAHQIICEYLAEKQRENERKLWRMRRIRIGILAAVSALMLAGGTVLYTEVIAPPQYSEMQADEVLAFGLHTYSAFRTQYEQLSELITCARKTPERFQSQLRMYEGTVKYLKYDDEEDYGVALERMLAAGEVMPWSKKPMQTSAYHDLFRKAAEYSEDYIALVDALAYVMADEKAYRQFAAGEGNFIETLADLADKDAEIIALLYQASCRIHQSERYAGAENTEAENYGKNTEGLNKLNAYFREDWSAGKIAEYLNEHLYGSRDDLRDSLFASPVVGLAEKMKKFN